MCLVLVYSTEQLNAHYGKKTMFFLQLEAYLIPDWRVRRKRCFVTMLYRLSSSSFRKAGGGLRSRGRRDSMTSTTHWTKLEDS